MEVGAFPDTEAALIFLAYVQQYGDRTALDNLSRERADEIAGLLKERVVFEVLEQTTLSRDDILQAVKKLVDIRTAKINRMILTLCPIGACARSGNLLKIIFVKG